MTLDEFVRSGHDPTSVAVVAEDAAAVAGCAIASAALMATQHFGSSVFDAAGSIAVGKLLTDAMLLINSNRLLLLGRSLGPEKMRRITDAVRADPVVEEVYRAKSEELGPGTYRFVAEIEFSGSRVVERYLDQGDGAKREQLHGVFRSAVEEGAGSGDPRALDAALKLRGEEVVTAVGDEVDRIEKAIVRVEPTIHYVDLEAADDDAGRERFGVFPSRTLPIGRVTDQLVPPRCCCTSTHSGLNRKSRLSREQPRLPVYHTTGSQSLMSHDSFCRVLRCIFPCPMLPQLLRRGVETALRKRLVAHRARRFLGGQGGPPKRFAPLRFVFSDSLVRQGERGLAFLEFCPEF